MATLRRGAACSRPAACGAAIVLLFALSACAPRLTVLRGTGFTGPLPNTEITQRRVLNFKWQYNANRGVGRISIAPPDSARVDMELQGGQVATCAILIGAGPIRSPDEEALTRMLPTPELVWAAVGRLAVPAAGDTIKVVQDGLLSADIGLDPTWRATFDGGRLVRLEKAVRGRLAERVTRGPDGTIAYKQGNNTLGLTEVKDTIAAPYKADIWRC